MNLKDIKTYVLHYKKLVDRKAFTQMQLEKLGINPEWILDFDAEELTDEIINEFYKHDVEEGFRRVRPLWPINQHNPRKLNSPEISLTIKHIVTLDKISKSNDDISLVLEDDCLFCNDFETSFNELLESTPDDWDVIHIGDGFGMKPEKYKSSFSDKVYLMHHPASRCTEAILFKKSAAQKIVSTMKPFCLMVDWEMAYQYSLHNLNVYWWQPAPITQASHKGIFRSSLR